MEIPAARVVSSAMMGGACRIGLMVILPKMMLIRPVKMLDTTKAGLGFIRAFLMKDLADDGDADKRWIGGDYTLQLMNEQAHAYRYGFS